MHGKKEANVTTLATIHMCSQQFTSSSISTGTHWIQVVLMSKIGRLVLPFLMHKPNFPPPYFATSHCLRSCFSLVGGTVWYSLQDTLISHPSLHLCQWQLTETPAGRQQRMFKSRQFFKKPVSYSLYAILFSKNTRPQPAESTYEQVEITVLAVSFDPYDVELA